jgi:hypothetical protein
VTRPIILDVSLWSRSVGPRLPEPKACPRCGSRDFVPIVYGLLSEEGMAEARAGKFVCGGCMLDDPRWYCRGCNHRWPKDGPWPTDEEYLAYRLRWERYSRRPDVFLVITIRKMRWFIVELVQKFMEEYIRIPLLIHREKPAIDKRIALKNGGYRYMVRFRNEVVRVSPKYGDPNLLEAHCTSRKNYLAGTPESRRYKAVAMRLVLDDAPQYRAPMEAAKRELRGTITDHRRRR